MKLKALRAGDAHSHEDEECRKRSTLRFGRCLTSVTGAQQRARRENVLRHILSYYFFISGREKINSVPTPSVLITLIFCNGYSLVLCCFLIGSIQI